MGQQLRIVFLSHDENLLRHMELRLQSKGYQMLSLPEPHHLLGILYSDPPDIVIIDFSSPHPEFRSVLNELKYDNYFSLIPVIGLINETSVEEFEWDEYPFDDFVTLPVNYSDLFSRILLSLQRIQRVFDNNPLTKLPGNTSTQQAIAASLHLPMSVCYIDINHFKPYNDTYGFSRGDEVLRMLARIMSNAVKESKGEGFVGHIGGDDFVFIVPFENTEQVCKTIIDNFNIIVSDLFGEEDKHRGYYIANDRKGEVQKIPLLGISIAVVPTDNPSILHAGQVVEIATELKKLAKKSNKSCYVINRRKTQGADDSPLERGQ